MRVSQTRRVRIFTTMMITFSPPARDAGTSPSFPDPDRGFQVGDSLCLREYDAASRIYSGRLVTAKVIYVLIGPKFGIEAGYCVMSLGAMRKVEG